MGRWEYGALGLPGSRGLLASCGRQVKRDKNRISRINTRTTINSSRKLPWPGIKTLHMGRQTVRYLEVSTLYTRVEVRSTQHEDK